MPAPPKLAGVPAEMHSARAHHAEVLIRDGPLLWRQAGLTAIALAEARYEDAARVAGYAWLLLAHHGIERGGQERRVSAITAKIDARIGTAQGKAPMKEGARLTEA